MLWRYTMTMAIPKKKIFNWSDLLIFSEVQYIIIMLGIGGCGNETESTTSLTRWKQHVGCHTEWSLNKRGLKAHQHSDIHKFSPTRPQPLIVLLNLEAIFFWMFQKLLNFLVWENWLKIPNILYSIIRIKHNEKWKKSKHICTKLEWNECTHGIKINS